jgi:hypothetical protein
MPMRRALKLIRKAREEDRRERYYRLWLVRYPGYTEKNFETFEDFYEKIFPPKVEYDMRSNDEIMAEILGGEDL